MTVKTKSPFNVLKRLVSILKILSTSTGRKIGTEEIIEKLKNKYDIDISRRTVQRDLHMLHELGIGIDVDKHSPMGAKINAKEAWLKTLLQQSVEQK